MLGVMVQWITDFVQPIINFWRNFAMPRLPRMEKIWERLNQFERFILSISLISSLVIFLTYSWKSNWPFSIHSNWQLTYAAGAVFTFLLLFFRLADRDQTTRHSFESVSAFFTTLALLAAGYWYFYERPGVPKLDIQTHVEAWPIGEGLALVRIEAKLKNVGSTVINFDRYKYQGGDEPRDDRFKVDLGKVLPFDREYASNKNLLEMLPENSDNNKFEFAVDDTYFWKPIARHYFLPDGEIEAGETEQYYYKILIPCDNGMILASTIRVPKVGSVGKREGPGKGKSLIWLAQSLSEPVENCV